MPTAQILLVAGLSILGLLIGFAIGIVLGKLRIKREKMAVDKMLVDAERELEVRKNKLELEFEKERARQKAEFERSTQAKKNELAKQEKRLRELQDSLTSRNEFIERKKRELEVIEKQLKSKERAISEKENQLDELIRQQNERLEHIAGMTQEEAKRILMDNLLAEARADAAQMIKRIKEEAEAKAEKEAREVIINAIQRCSADVTAEATVSVVSLPSDEIKGRIIGREGRNIRAFETATGVDVIVDDTPEAVILSAHDPIRREIARLALEKLIVDGRIHPGRIEETVAKAQKEMEVILKETGEQTCFELGLHDVNSDMVKLIGRLKYRTSYGQNVLQHSVEVAWLAGYMAEQLDLEPKIARRCGLLHDIGKAVDRGQEGTHTQLGYEVAKKYNENEIVLNAILAHHEDVEITSPYTVLVQAADAISGARPGARRETLENYIKRLQKLEELADSFPGVTKAYAIQAGREVRVIVEPQQVSDSQAETLAAEIAQKIEKEMEFPGQIKVTVIRETRVVDYAK